MPRILAGCFVHIAGFGGDFSSEIASPHQLIPWQMKSIAMHNPTNHSFSTGHPIHTERPKSNATTPVMMVQAGARDRVATKRDNRISPLTTKKIATKAARPTIRWSGLTMTAMPKTASTPAAGRRSDRAGRIGLRPCPVHAGERTRRHRRSRHPRTNPEDPEITCPARSTTLRPDG